VSVDPGRAIASFDSASVLHAATVRSLERRPFPHVGNPPPFGAIVRALGHLPWPLLRKVYQRIGGAEGIDPRLLADIDFGEVAASFAEPYGTGPWPAVILGSSNGAMTHLAAAMQVPWLPGTALVPVSRSGDPHEPDRAMEFGASWAPGFLANNPDVVLHQMHDPAQDELMTARMVYFRVKWATLPDAYRAVLERSLAPGGTVIVLDDESRWPVTRVSDRHVFQTGGRGGLQPEDYQRMPHAPAADDEAVEAEWGAEPGFTAAVERWAAENGHPVVRIRIDGPQELAHPVAQVLRGWTRDRGGAADGLIMPSFVLADPWRTIELGLVPFWTFFPVASVVDSLRFHLANTEPYSTADLVLFQHGAPSPNLATPGAVLGLAREFGAEPNLLAVRAAKSPHDIRSIGAFGPELARRPDAGLPFEPLRVEAAIAALAAVTSERGRSVVAEPRRPGGKAVPSVGQ
jgi:hypothetical protein